MLAVAPSSGDVDDDNDDDSVSPVSLEYIFSQMVSCRNNTIFYEQ